MKKKLMTFVVIVSTLVTVTVLLGYDKKILDLLYESYNKYYIYNKGNSDKFNILHNEALVKDNKESNVKTKKDDLQLKDNSKSKDNEEKFHNEGEGGATPLSEKDRNMDNKKDGENISSYLKVSISEIKENISLSEKLTMVDVAKKISPTDYARISSLLQKDINSNTLIDIVSLLKTRLGKKDYDKFKEVAVKYVDLERIEKEVKNKNEFSIK